MGWGVISGRSYSSGRYELIRKLAVVASAIGLLGLSLSLIAPAPADSRYDKVTIRLAEKFSDDDENFVDTGATGFSVGDYLVFGNDPLYNRARTKKRGWGSGQCVFVNVKGETATAECDVSFYLDGGLLTFEGSFTGTEQSTEFTAFAVTGGTDDYETAHGTAEIDQDDVGLIFTLKLLL
jgi:hypothetical protein